LAAATAKGEGLVLHEAWLAQMERFFAERGRVMAPSNRKQAEIPASAESSSIIRLVRPADSPSS
jgi:molybdopterin-biosynthesis enzyme MoeA-like protein